jgi:Spy/CpxP family protein refolding chaperone
VDRGKDLFKNNQINKGEFYMRTKNISSILIGLVILLFISQGNTQARYFQRGKNPGGLNHAHILGEPGLTDLEEILSLTTEQQTQIREILRDHKDEMRRDFKGSSPADRRQVHDELRAALYDEIMPVLNPDQKKILSEIKSEFAAGRVPEVVIDTRVRRLTADLDLEDDQAGKIKTLFANFGERMIRLRNSDNPERGEMRDLFFEMHEELETILNPDQMMKLRKIRDKRTVRDGRRGIRGNPERLAKMLDLTPDQEQQVQNIFAEAREKMRTDLRAHREKIALELEQVLTDEQMEKFKSMQDEFQRGSGRGHRNHGRRF